jgi:adenylate cyclase
MAPTPTCFLILIGIDEAGMLAGVSDMWGMRSYLAGSNCHGPIVKMMGDGTMEEFASAVDAVDQAAMLTNNTARMGQDTIDLRIGVNLGDTFGNGVNIAVRLERRLPGPAFWSKYPFD